MFVFRARIFSLVAAVVFTAAFLRAQEKNGQPAQAAPPQALPGVLPKPVSAANTPRIDDGASVPGLAPAGVGNFPAALPAGANAPQPSQPAPQNRIVPADADAFRSAGNRAAAQPAVPAAYSENWLVDGFRQLEADQRRERAQANRDGRRARGENEEDFDAVAAEQDFVATTDGADEKDANKNRNAASNTGGAFADYLQKWLTSPSSSAGIRGSANQSLADSQVALPGVSVLAEPAPAPVNAAFFPQAASQAAGLANKRYAAALDPTRTELEGAGPSIVLPPTALPAAGDDALSSVLAPAASATAAGAANNEGVSAGKKLTVKENKFDAEPAKPIVNDKKYFPQLQRF